MATILDPAKNFIKCLVDGEHDGVTTTILLQSGEGGQLPNPATLGAYNMSWWDITSFPDPSDDPNVEIVRVTGVTGDVVTVLRGQESIAASTKNTAGHQYLLALTITNKLRDNIETALDSGRKGIDNFYTTTTFAPNQYDVTVPFDVGVGLPNINGLRLTLRMSSSNTGPAALRVNGASFAGIQKAPWPSLLTTGDLIAGATYDFVFNFSGPSWEVQNPSLADIAQGGTGQVTKAPAFLALSPATTKGDLITHNGTTNIRKAVGVDGQVLQADVASADGVRWRDLETVKRTTIDQANATNVAAKVTALDVTLGVGTWAFKYLIRHQASLVTTGVAFSVNHTGTLTSFVSQLRFVDTNSNFLANAQKQGAGAATFVGGVGARVKSATANMGPTLSADVANADLFTIIEGLLVVTVSGTLELWSASEVPLATTTVMANSAVIFTQLD